MSATAQQYKPPLILVVDDDESSRFLLQQALSDLGEVVCAASGAEGLEIAQAQVPDVILLDVYMPGLNGMDVCQQLKSTPHLCDIPIVFVTASDDQELEVTSLAAGGIDLIRKPFEFGVCQLRVRNLLEIQTKRKALELAHADMHALVQSLPVHVTLWSADWINQYCNDSQGNWFKLAADASPGHQIEDIFPDSLVQSIQAMARLNTDTYKSPISCQCINGLRHVLLTVTKRLYKNNVEGYLVSLYDVTNLVNAEKSLFQEKERMRVTLNSIGDAVIATDTDGKVTFINPIAERMTGFSASQAIHRSIESIMDIRDATTKEPAINPAMQALKVKQVVGMAMNCQLKSRTGDIYRIEDSAAPIFNANNEITGSVIVFHDVSEAVAMAIKMSHLSNYDQLTDLPNRMLLQDRLEQSIREALALQTKVALYLIDLDHFKYLNDSLGHEKGDRLLKITANRLAGVILPKCTAARMGGDEFVVIYPNTLDHNEIHTFANRIRESLEEPIRLEDKEYSLSCSIGISVFPDDSQSIDEILRHADAAMYRAKHDGRKRHCFFSHTLEESIVARQNIEQRLRQAIKTNSLEVHFQPKVRLIDGTIYGAEALVRLRDDNGSLISPADFIHIAEEIGLASELGNQVLTKACSATEQWLKVIPDFVISVNVSASQIINTDYSHQLKATLTSLKFSPENLEIEVTESMLMKNIEIAQHALGEAHALGVKIAIDDFGTGYSSLSYLKRFRVDTLKIDQSFVRDMTTDNNDYDIVKAVIQLGNSFNMDLCAEGIEELDQVNALKELNCSNGQGYYFGKPMPKDEFDRLITTRKKSSLLQKLLS